jgi:hypothetical protein
MPRTKDLLMEYVTEAGAALAGQAANVLSLDHEAEAIQGSGLIRK